MKKGIESEISQGGERMFPVDKKTTFIYCSCDC